MILILLKYSNKNVISYWCKYLVRFDFTCWNGRYDGKRLAHIVGVGTAGLVDLSGMDVSSTSSSSSNTSSKSVSDFSSSILSRITSVIKFGSGCIMAENG